MTVIMHLSSYILFLAVAAIASTAATELEGSERALPDPIKTKLLHENRAEFEAVIKKVPGIAASEKLGTRQLLDSATSNSTTAYSEYRLDPEVDDAVWPGLFPSQPGHDLVINIKTDLFPRETFFYFETVFSPLGVESTSRNFQGTHVPTPKQGGNSSEPQQNSTTTGIYSFNVSNVNVTGSLYRIEIIDTAGTVRALDLCL